MAQPRENRGSFGKRSSIDQWSQFCFQCSASACLSLPSPQGGKVRRCQQLGFVISFHGPPSPTNPLQELKFSFLPDILGSQPHAIRPSGSRARSFHIPHSATGTEERDAALPQSLHPTRAPSFSVPSRPGNGRSTRGAAANSVSYWPGPPGPPCPPTHPGQPRAPPPRASPAVLKGPGPQSNAGLTALSRPAWGLSVSQERLGISIRKPSTGGGAPA